MTSDPVERSGRLLTKDELIQTIWPDSVVEENNKLVTRARREHRPCTFQKKLWRPALEPDLGRPPEGGHHILVKTALGRDQGGVERSTPKDGGTRAQHPDRRVAGGGEQPG